MKKSEIDELLGPVIPLSDEEFARKCNSDVQKILLDLIKIQQKWNEFDGNQVYQDLVNNVELWESVFMDGNGLIKLRDIPSNLWNVDTLHILSSGVDNKELRKILKSWNPTTMKSFSGEKVKRAVGSRLDSKNQVFVL